ncbi:MAG: ribosome silencing factor [Chloroflexota bacterium]|nr:ribosome silencing factor [Chloroflexota bacterium]
MNTGGILESTEIAKKAVEAAIDRQANDILMLDIRQVQYFADYFVICSAESDRQMRAICDEIHEKLKQERIRLLHQEGSEDSGWALLDFGSVVVHVFAPDQREFYDIENVWRDAIPVLRIL